MAKNSQFYLLYTYKKLHLHDSENCTLHRKERFQIPQNSRNWSILEKANMTAICLDFKRNTIVCEETNFNNFYCISKDSGRYYICFELRSCTFCTIHIKLSKQIFKFCTKPSLHDKHTQLHLLAVHLPAETDFFKSSNGNFSCFQRS